MQPPESAEEASRLAERAIDQGRRTIDRFLNAADAAAAAKFVEAELKKARSLGHNDPKRGDALALKLHLQTQQGNYHEAVPVAAEIVRIRQAARPVDFGRLALALSQYALPLFGDDQEAAGDRALDDSRQAWGKAFAPDDIRLAQQLKIQAEFIGNPQGLNRPRQAILFLKEAVAVRERAKNGLPEALADTLQTLGMLELTIGDLSAADAHLARAADILAAEADRQKVKQRADELRGGLVDILVMRAGLAIETGLLTRADELMKQAQAVPIGDSADALDQRVLMAKLRGNILERQGDVDGALDQSMLQLQLVHRIVPVDPDLVGLVEEAIGDLLRDKNELDRARDYYQDALQLRGGEGLDTAPLMLKLAALDSLQGHAAAAEQRYRRGLQFRKGATSEVPVLFGTNRARLAGADANFGADFGADFGASTTLGAALVLVPGGPGSRDALNKRSRKLPSLYDPATNADRLILFRSEVLTEAAFGESISHRARRAVLYPGAALIFVRGYANNFQFAVARIAQLVRDLNFDGPAFAFSWPSQGSNSLDAYKTDQASARDTVASLIAFMQTVARGSAAGKIHLIAHSMGNEILLAALIELGRAQYAELSKRIGEVVLASPDVDQSQFARQIAELGLRRLTLYASRHDLALKVSRFMNVNSIRAGYVASGVPVVVPGLDSIDVSEGGDDIFATNHNIYADNPVVTDDLRKLLQNGVHPPSDRSGALLETKYKDGAAYWYYHRPQIN